MTEGIPGLAKLRRAEDLLHALDEEIFAFCNGPYDVYELVREIERWDSGEDAFGEDWIIRVKVNRELDPHWSLLIGEALHDLRSSLDHLAWALAGGDGSAPDDTEFPIFKDPVPYSVMVRRGRHAGEPARTSGLHKVRGMKPPAQTAVELLQPYRRPDPESHPLWVLHRLNATDKHRALHVLGVVNHDPSAEITIRSPGIHLSGSPVVFPGPVVDGAELCRVNFVGSRERYRHYVAFGDPSRETYDHDVEVKLKSPFQVAFDESGPANGKHVVPVLVASLEAVEHMFRALLPLLGHELPPSPWPVLRSS